MDAGTKIEELLHRTVDAGASDLHLKDGRPPTIRVDGVLEPVGDEPLSAADTYAIAEVLMPAWRIEAFASRGEIDFAPVAHVAHFGMARVVEHDRLIQIR